MIILLFIIYTTIIFLIKNIYILLSLLLLNIIFIKFNKKYFNYLKKNIILLLIIFIFNLIFSNLETSLIYVIRLLIVLNICYTLYLNISYSKIIESFYYLLYPLKLFKVNLRDILVILSIGISFIPIIESDVKKINLTLKSMGFNINFKNVITKPYVFVIPLINNILNRVEDIEKYLIVSGYN